MSNTTYYFTVHRKGLEINLSADFEVDSFSSYAQMEDVVFIEDDGEYVPWDGFLTYEEKNRVERNAYAEWKKQSDGPIDFDDDVPVLEDYLYGDVCSVGDKY
jgi:hypothetical protein